MKYEMFEEDIDRVEIALTGGELVKIRGEYFIACIEDDDRIQFIRLADGIPMGKSWSSSVICDNCYLVLTESDYTLEIFK